MDESLCVYRLNETETNLYHTIVIKTIIHRITKISFSEKGAQETAYIKLWTATILTLYIKMMQKYFWLFQSL